MSFAALTTILLASLLATALLVVGYVLSRRLMTRRRVLNEISVTGDRQDKADEADLNYVQSKQADEFIRNLNRYVQKLVGPVKFGPKVQQKLIKAGIFNPNAVVIFLASRIVLGLVPPLIFIIAARIFAADASSLALFFIPLVMALLGAVMPDFYVSRRERQYQEETRRAFPDFLDLLVVAADAGMGLEQAIGRVGEEIIKSSPGLGASLQLLILELRMGHGFTEALNNFVGRTNVEEIRAFSTLVQQSRELGASVTTALRVYSDDMRNKRMSIAEEKAAALPVKLVIPLGIFLFPIMVVIVMLPVFVRIINSGIFAGS